VNWERASVAHWPAMKRWRSRVALVVAAALALLAGLAPPTTTTVSAATYVYDAQSNARVGAQAFGRVDAGPTPLGEVRGRSVLRSTGRRAPSTTPTATFVATEAVEIGVSRSRYPQSAAHIDDAQAAGQPTQLTIDRSGAAARRRASMEGQPRQPGLVRDEYPPAMFEEGGSGSSVRAIDPSDNRGAGASIGNQCWGLPDGTVVQIVVTC